MPDSTPPETRDTATTEHHTVPGTPIRVVVAGYSGRMGRVITERLPSESIEIVGTLGRGDDIAKTLTTSRADVVVDFTEASYAATLMRDAIGAGVRPVSGTTGLQEGLLDEIDALARQHDSAAVWAPHFSRSGVLLAQFARIADFYMNSVEIVERHHATKADAPSGTARELVRTIREAIGSDFADSPTHLLVYGASGEGDADVRVHSIRTSDVVGSHELIFGGTREILRVRWDVFSRDTTVAGVAHAVRQVVRPDLVGLIRSYDSLLELLEP
jgi:4-hydroxy-tetrahydrodipicolinate reductase